MEALCPRSPSESFLRDPYRLACQAVVIDDSADIGFSPLRRKPQILTQATPVKTLRLDPMVTRQGEAVAYDGQVIDRCRGRLYGLAMDLGTTTVVIELVDLESGDTRAVASFENPQRFGGSDIMNRISYDGGPFQGELHQAIIKGLNYEIREICKRLGIRRQEIYEVAVAGNSTMRDLFFGLDVQSIGQKPYKSLIENEVLQGKRTSMALTVEAKKLGVQVHPRARIFGLPLIASHVGADTAADLVAIDMERQDEVTMLVDVGTNTEVVVGYGERMMTASCPAGPAFEGGLVKYGMPGCEGAIETIGAVGGRFDYRTIGGVEPQGICGSGLIDLLAELRRTDQMTPKGVFANKAFEISVVPEHGITLSREDASNLAQAKAANFCGQFIVMRRFGISPGDVRRLYLAGGFANYVNVANAIDIGFLAPVDQDRIVKVGNAAVQGARTVLLSRSRRESLERLVKRIEHVELETTPDFFEVFVEGCQFKPMPRETADLKVG
jgi:uncharacterized 2Fe-2S/4Fe-4S cluster protein (DUF4445 family)